jgi:ElaB/YqjD/DUF883 family membrane-anchored ribosome-binding protein
MTTVTEKTVQQKIEELIEQRDRYVQEANQQIAALNGAIQVLEGLLMEEVEQPQKAAKEK